MICKNCKKETEQITNLDLINGGLCPKCYNLLNNKEYQKCKYCGKLTTNKENENIICCHCCYDTQNNEDMYTPEDYEDDENDNLPYC